MRLAILLVVLTATAAQAREKDLLACVKIAENNVRLACFDQAMQKNNSPVKKLSAANVNKSVAQDLNKTNTVPLAKVAATPAAVKKASVNDFGREHIKVSQGLAEVTLTIKSLKKNAYKQYKIAFENGQVWQQKDSSSLKLKLGEQVLIKRGALSSFYLKKLTSNRSVKVKRIK